MVIGIGNNYTKEGKKILKEYFEKKNYLFVDCDKVVDKIKMDFENKNKLDKYIRKNIELVKDIVIDFNNLYNYKDYVDLCDYVIDINHNHLINEIGVNRTENRIIVYSPENKYFHNSINFNNRNWQKDLENDLNFNINNKIKVSIVVPIYNSAVYLGKCIESIISQSYKNLEIILVDDGSTDNSLKIIKEYKKNDNRIKFFHKENGGLSSTRNFGLKKATGEYIMFIDSDDYIDNRMVELMLKKIIEKNVDICECGIFVHNKDNTIVCNYDFLTIDKMTNQIDLVNSYADGIIIIAVWNKLFKLDAIKNIEFRLDCFKEDSDYVLRLCQKELSITQVAIPLYHYIKKESGSLTGNKFSNRFFNLADWAEEKAAELLSDNIKYKDAADKILFNSYVHILKYYLRDYNKGILNNSEFKEEIINIYNKLVKLIINTNNVTKYKNFNNVIQIMHLFIDKEIIKRSEVYTQSFPCIGIIWNSLNDNYKQEVVNEISKFGKINKIIKIDLGEKYQKFIEDIYVDNKEAEGIPFIKYATLKDQFDNNEIELVYANIDVCLYEYTNNLKGFQFERLAELKRNIRGYYKKKIKKYAFDNIFHLTMNMYEYELTDKVLKKYLGKNVGDNYE